MTIKNFIHNITRYLAPASLMVLAACQHTEHRRAAAGPATPHQATAASQQPPRPSSEQDRRAATDQTAPAITFNLAQTQPAQGLVQLRVGENTNLYAVPQPVFTQADIQQVASMQDQDKQAFLRFDFNQQGAEKLAKITREAMGHYLIVSVHGKLVAIQRISPAQQYGKLPVRVNSENDSQAVLNSLRQPAG